MFKECLASAPLNEAQQKDTDILLSVGETFTLVVYGQLLLENAKIYEVGADLVDQMFDWMVRDMSKYALQLYGKPSATAQQMDYCMKMIRKPATDAERYDRVWREQVYSLKDAYEMRP